ncbi:MAG: hypothetical protein V4820_00815 [Pseudomonadota bacterium]
MGLGGARLGPGGAVAQTVFDWIERYLQFADPYRRADVAGAPAVRAGLGDRPRATPETAYAARVKIEAARWQAGRLATKRYRLKGEDGDERPQVNVFMQKFGEDDAVPA